MEFVLRALDGSNPLAFLASLGAVRQCDLLWPDRRVRMYWTRYGPWRPVLSGIPAESESDLCQALASSDHWAPLEKFDALGNNLTVSRELFAAVIQQMAQEMTQGSRSVLDFACAFGNEAFEDKKKNRIQYTDLSFIAGSGHQHFLGTARALRKCCSAEHLAEALFGPWCFANVSNSFRWDPSDAKEYALRWQNPSKGGVATVWGANRLAFEALPFFPMVPTSRGLRTTGFHTSRGRSHEFTWPIWRDPIGVDTIRCLVSLRKLHCDNVDRKDREELAAQGIEEIFRAERVRIGQGANFKVSFRAARSA